MKKLICLQSRCDPHGNVPSELEQKKTRTRIQKQLGNDYVVVVIPPQYELSHYLECVSSETGYN